MTNAAMNEYEETKITLVYPGYEFNDEVIITAEKDGLRIQAFGDKTELIKWDWIDNAKAKTHYRV